MSKFLYLTSHSAHLQIAYAGSHATQVFFSIDDRKTIAWYVFWESNPAFSAGMDRDLMTGQDGSHYVLGQATKSTPFQPLNGTKVDQFANGNNSASTRARAAMKFANNIIAFEIKVLLTAGAEFLDCRFGSKTRPLGVDKYERGFVSLQRVEKYSGAAISSGGRSFAPRYGTRTNDPVIVTDE